jgi:hypothetical protein
MEVTLSLHTLSIYLQTVHPNLGRWHLKCKQRPVKPQKHCQRISQMSLQPRSPALWHLERRATTQGAFVKVSLTDPKCVPTANTFPLEGCMHMMLLQAHILSLTLFACAPACHLALSCTVAFAVTSMVRF